MVTNNLKSILLIVSAILMSFSILRRRSADWFDRRLNELQVASEIEDTPGRVAALGEFMSITSHGRMDGQQRHIFEKA